MTDSLEQCSNCNRVIPSGIIHRRWQGKIVCAPCFLRFESNDLQVPAAVDPRTAVERHVNRPFVYHLRVPRTLLFFAAIIASFWSLLSKLEEQLHPYLDRRASFTVAWILWAAWLAMGAVSAVWRSEWKARNRRAA